MDLSRGRAREFKERPDTHAAHQGKLGRVKCVMEHANIYTLYVIVLYIVVADSAVPPALLDNVWLAKPPMACWS